MTEREGAADPRRSLVAVLTDTGGWSGTDAEQDVPTEGEPTTYVVFITPHLDEMYPEDDDEDYQDDEEEDEDDEPEDEPGVRRAWPDQFSLEASVSVLVYAVPDSEIADGDRQVLAAADGVFIDDLDAVEAASRAGKARVVARWFDALPGGRSRWGDRLAFSYYNNPLEFLSHGRSRLGPPSSLVTITLPPSVHDGD